MLALTMTAATHRLVPNTPQRIPRADRGVVATFQPNKDDHRLQGFHSEFPKLF